MQKNQTKRLVNIMIVILVISSLILSTIPINVIIVPVIEEGNVKPLKNDEFNKVNRLMHSSNTHTKLNNSVVSNPVNQNLPNFAIGTQIGTGGGSYSIYDSFNWTGTESLTIQNEYDPIFETVSNRSTSISITNSSGYNRPYGTFNISDVKALSDIRLVEDRDTTEFKNSASGDDRWFEVSMSFSISEDQVNLTKVRTYTTNVGGGANGTIYILNSTFVSPYWEPDDTKLLSSKEILTKSGATWNEYVFDEPILLKSGVTYYVVMNDTSVAGYWNWAVDDDTVGGETDEGNLFRKHNNHNLNGWQASPEPYDLPIQLELIPVEWNGTHWDNKTYTTPQDVGFCYNTTETDTELTSFVWFDWHNRSAHNFQTTTSVSFSLSFIANYTYSSYPFLASSSYLVSNNTKANWNLTFSTVTLNTTYSIRNHMIKITGVEDDWDGAYIYWDDTLEYDDLDNDVNVTLDGNPSNLYVNGSNRIVVNASTLSASTTWHVCFDALNYMYYFNLSGVPLGFPYKANVTDTVGLNFQVDETGGNTSYWIEYYGQYIHSRTDFSSDAFTDFWIINDSVSQTTNVNGTYDLQAFWIDSAETKVGTITRKLDVFINTTIDIKTETELLVDKSVTIDDNIQITINDLLNITVLYNSTHNESIVHNADIWCETNWTVPTKTRMNQIADDSYNASFDTSGRKAGELGNLTIFTNVSWFVNWTKTIWVHFVDISTLFVNTTQPTQYLEWKDNITLEISYENSSGHGVYPGASFDIDGMDIFPTWDGGDEVYRFTFFSTNYSGVGSYPSINISAEHNDYLNQIWTFPLVINPGNTNITGTVNGNPHSNKTDMAVTTFANSSLDSITINLQYYHILTNENLTSGIPVFESLLPNITNPVEQPDTSWTIVFNPNQTGVFVINVTFSSSINYTDSLFMLNVTVLNAPTQIQTNHIDNSTIYYAEPYEFSVFYNNTYWNENITFNPVLGNTYTINDESKIQLINRTGDLYWFIFNNDSTVITIGVHSINITFKSINYFEDSWIIVWFNVTKSPFVDVNGTEIISGDELINSTSTYDRPYSPTGYDNLTLLFNYFANKTNQNLTVSVSEITIIKDSSITNISIPQGNNNWLFIFNGSLIGTFSLEIIFSHENYTSVMFEVFYNIEPADSSFTEFSSSIDEYPIIPYNGSVKSGNTLDFWIVWESQYGEYINDSDGVNTNASSIVTFLSSDSSNGTHYFRFTAGPIGLVAFNLTFGTSQYYAINITLTILIVDRALQVNNTLSSHPSGWVWDKTDFLRYGDTYYFNVYIQDYDNGSSIDITVFPPINLPVNVTFENVTNGYHLFSYEALFVGTTSTLTITFDLTNYVSATYDITFIVVQSESEIVSVPTIVSTYWTQDVNFSAIWQSIPFTQQNTTNIVLKINSTSISTSQSWITFQEFSNGNYTFLIEANTAGTFIVTLYFQSNRFQDQSYDIQIRILPIPTDLGSDTFPANDSTIGDFIPFYFSHNYNFIIHWQDSFNNSDIVDSVPSPSGTGSSYLTFVDSFSNGTHLFSFNAAALGTFQVIIILSTTNFGEVSYVITFTVSIMPTQLLNLNDIHFNESILVEDVLQISGDTYSTFQGTSIPSVDSVQLWMNGSKVPIDDITTDLSQYPYLINISTIDYQWGNYNVSLEIRTYGYQPQMILFNITLQGREITVTLDIPQGDSVEWGEDIDFVVFINYTDSLTGGGGASINLESLEGVNVSFKVTIEYRDGSTVTFEETIPTDPSQKATYTISGEETRHAKGFTEISVFVASSLSGLPVSYSMPSADFPKIQPPFDLLATLLPYFALFAVLLVAIFLGVVLNRKRKQRTTTIQTKRRKVEQKFEDIKSIRLLIARHESGLQFYSEKTIAGFQIGTDALSGMSAALSSFMEEVSTGMSARTDEQKQQDRIEVMSREGLHMLAWHGRRSSFIIISEVRLPDYFSDRLRSLGNEVEAKFMKELEDFYRSDQVPSSVIKKMVRKHIPLHYFSAFILNEGVLTLDSIKLSSKEKKMLELIKKIPFIKEGIQFFFSEMIISHLSKHYNRSEAIKFLDRAIELNLLIEASQEDIMGVGK